MNILFGVTGGIAIYKSLNVIRLLTKEGHDVKVIMTENATRFISPILFKTLSNNDVYVEDFNVNYPLAHIKLADWADVFAVAPASANTIAKIAHGIADNLLTSNFLAFSKRKVIFPAMNVNMYENPITRDNIERLSKLEGYEVYEPESGDLACGYSAKGRLPDEEFISGILGRDVNGPLKGKKYIVTAGGTVEKIDPVRYISNFSSGKMGVELAKAIFRAGGDVLLVTAKITVSVPPYINRLRVDSCDRLLDVLMGSLSGYDGLYMAAAPADYRVKNQADHKLKKGIIPKIELEENPDILKALTSSYPEKKYVGFALETDNFEVNAVNKLGAKKLNYIVLNPLTPDFTPMGSDTNSVILLSEEGERKEMKNRSKKEIARWLVELTA